MPACEVCSAPAADWLEETSALACERAVAIACNPATPAPSTKTLAGATVPADATTYTLESTLGSETYGILSNQFLAAQARTVRYEVNIDVREDGVFSYEEVSLIEHGKMTEHLSHTDSNTLYRIADA